MICNDNESDKVLKFISKNIKTHRVPRKIYMDQGSTLTSQVVKEFCNTEGVEIMFPPLNDHRASVCVERAIGSYKNFVLTYAEEENHGDLEKMVERALGTSRLAPNIKLKCRHTRHILAGRQTPF